MKKSALATAALFAVCLRAAGEPPKPNILLIMLDTVRADRVGCYGYQRPTTPALDALAAEGVVFATTYATSSWTMPSLGTLFTGVHPRQHGAVCYRQRLRPELTTLAAELAAGGYQTAAVISNPTASRKFGYAKGFELYDDTSVFAGIELDLFGADGQSSKVHQALTGATVNRIAMKWLREKRAPDRPFFLFVLYFDPHADYVPPRRYAQMFTDPDYTGRQDGRDIYSLHRQPSTLTPADVRHLSDLYDAEIRYTDDRMAELLDELAAVGASENTVVVVLSDHGEEFMEHQGLVHGGTLYDETTKVPWVMRGPGLPSGRRIEEMVSFLDFMPTMLDLAGIPVSRQCLGRNLMPRVRGAGALAPRPAFLDSEAMGKSLAAIVSPDGRYKVVLDRLAGELQGFDLVHDPGENVPLPPEDARLAPLVEELRQWQAEMPAVGVEKPDIDPKLLQQLKALGYAH